MEIRRDILPVLRPVGDVEIYNEVIKTMDSGWWGKGPRTEQFENEFAEMVGAKYAVAVTSATAGQDLILKALNLQNTDIINPTISFLTTAVVPLWNNCSSNIVDVDPINLNIDPMDVKKSLRKNTSAVIAVNHAGVPAPIDEIREFFDGFILEDCAHSCFTPGAGQKGDAAVWSFQAVKTLATGDGGMITTNDKDLYEKLVPMTWLGIPSTFSRISKEQNVSNTQVQPYTWEYDVDILGYKCYMIDLIASIGIAQMKKLPANLAWRRHIQTRYNLELHSKVIRPPWSETVQYYCARVSPNLRNPLISYLGSKKITASVHFKPLHKFAITKKDREFPVADVEWLKLISLPCHNAMTEEDIDYVIYWVNQFFAEHDK